MTDDLLGMDESIQMTDELAKAMKNEYALPMTESTVETMDTSLTLQIQSDDTQQQARNTAHHVRQRIREEASESEPHVITLTGAEWQYAYGSVATMRFDFATPEQDAPETERLESATDEIEETLGEGPLREYIASLSDAMGQMVRQLEDDK